MKRALLVSLSCWAFWVLEATAAQAGLYWFHNVRTNPTSVCFVGDALTSRPDRVQQIVGYIEHFEYAANIRFSYLGTCPLPTTQSNGNDYYGGDIRVVIPNTSISGIGPVPGKGCPMDGANEGWGSWSNAPDDLEANRSCLYNLKLGDDPWNDTPYLNHTLHELGHALGLSHEHERADATCPGPGGAAAGYLTPYDIVSVMHYSYSCTTGGNYAHTGLSPWDKLSLRILYPENGRPVQIVGRALVFTDETFHLQLGWKAEGANMAFVADSIAWRVNGVLASTTADLTTSLHTVGKYDIEVKFRDFLGRWHFGYRQLRVVEPITFNQQMGGLLATQALLLASADFVFEDGFERGDLSSWSYVVGQSP